ncbi:MAG: aspartate--tRNA ligase [Candidatus Woesearchaeota archaeon]|jgi:aspartyl-tRNA synthetase|nr:aspartate--tRNA ligase [Candidatus Woesearchaeota archaeon]
MMRTHNCGQLRISDDTKKVTLVGWAQRIRDHGGKKFIDLRDRYGITQIVFDPDVTKEFSEVENFKREYLIQIEGIVRPRPEGTINEKHDSGKIEIITNSFKVISKCETLPFPIDVENSVDVNEDLRLKHRYLDLRKKPMLEALQARAKLYKAIRDYLTEKDFIEVETPTLGKSTPEGARDMLVPSRKSKGNFYALPQSPQLFKQLLMIAGVEKYYQIARCYRDEDSRKDRQLEFTQLDMELSFVSQAELFTLMEELLQYSFKEAFNVEITTPFHKLTYAQSMDRFGSDKPDLRIKGMELKDISDIAKDSGFSVFANNVKSGGLVKGLNVSGGSDKFSRKDIDKLITFIQSDGGKGLAWVKVTSEGLESSITKFFTEEELKQIQDTLEAKVGDLLLFVADTEDKTNTLLDSLRRHLAKELGLIDESKHELAWIVDFPMFHWDEDAKVIESEHNPFTMCNEEFLPILEGIKDRDDAIAKKDELVKITTDCYDLVLDGIEIASGARRIHLPEIQKTIFEIIGLTKERVEEKFGWFVDAYNYSAPPHRGIAPGLDRIIMLLLGRDNIREVITFPKNKVGLCPMTNAPSPVDVEQLKDLGLGVIGVKKDQEHVKFPEKKF